jgi:hypothetical protein
VIEAGTIREILESRREGGIFSDRKPSDRAPSDKTALKETISRNAMDRLATLEKGFLLLENALSSIEQRMSALSNKREQRDEVVLELFRLLKASMASRKKMLLEILRLRKKAHEAGQDRQAENAGHRPTPFIFSKGRH